MVDWVNKWHPKYVSVKILPFVSSPEDVTCERQKRQVNFPRVDVNDDKELRSAGISLCLDGFYGMQCLCRSAWRGIQRLDANSSHRIAWCSKALLWLEVSESK